MRKNENSSLNAQIEKIKELSKAFESNSTDIKLFESFVATKLEKNYISPNIEIDEFNSNLAKVVAEIKNIDKTINGLNNVIRETETEISNQKKPLFFKKAYSEKNEALLRQLENYKKELAKHQEKKDTLQAKKTDLQSIIKKNKIDYDSINSTYSNDESKFEKVKNDILSLHIGKICFPPEEIINQNFRGEFETNYWYKYLIDSNYGKSVFDKIGWKYAYIIVSCFYYTQKDWITNKEGFLFENKFQLIKVLILNFLYNYKSNVIDSPDFLNEANRVYLEFYFNDKLIEIENTSIENLWTLYIISNSLLNIAIDTIEEHPDMGIGDVLSNDYFFSAHELYGFYLLNKPLGIWVLGYKEVREYLNLLVNLTKEDKDMNRYFIDQISLFEERHSVFRRLWK